MVDTANKALTNIAAALAMIGIRTDDLDSHAVTFKFTARHDGKGIDISSITLETKRLIAPPSTEGDGK